MKLHTPSDFIHCGLEECFTRGVMEELDHPAAHPLFHAGTQDKAIQRILKLLMEELETPRPSDRLYVDSLAHALASLYLSIDQGSKKQLAPSVSGLMSRVLSRMQEKSKRTSTA